MQQFVKLRASTVKQSPRAFSSTRYNTILFYLLILKTMKATRKEFLNSLNLDIDFNCLDDKYLNLINNFDDLFNLLEDCRLLNVDVIYYKNANKFLQENDPSFKDSLEIALQKGYTCDNLDSEILASVLATEMLRKEFSEKEYDINKFLN